MNNKIANALNKQINEEMFSAYLYLDMAAYAKQQGFDGFANWFEIQYKEELDHAMGFFHYILEIDAQVKLAPIAKPQEKYTSVSQLFDLALKHEQHITTCINDLYQLAATERNFALQSFLKWYLDEQVEEESNARTYIDKLNIADGNGQALLMLDNELAQRVYTSLNPMTK